MPYVKADQQPKTPEFEEYQKAQRNLLEVQREEADEHRAAWERGEKITPIARYEPDARTNYEVGEGWRWGRLSTTENGIHYISHDTSQPGPRILVDPDIAQWIDYSSVPEDDVYLTGKRAARSFASTIKGMENAFDSKPFTPFPLLYDPLLANACLADGAIFAVNDFDTAFGIAYGDNGIYRDPAYRVPFKAGGWVAVYASEVMPSPFARGPYANLPSGPLRVLWVNGSGEWGYSEHRGDEGPTDLRAMNGELRRLIATIRPVKDIPGFQMPPEKSIAGVLEASAEEGWPLERLVALARGDIEVDNPAMRWWR
ncbi:hypothetical protein [Calidithermus timidus]|jgi:hypothetical protein|uniref:hypothetical protein n=1 Tax=Calidithermus timidus TaxID=307124 RepID=UPI00037F1ED7|nr:hypothetical protein [Calidithermus timidus]